MHTILGFNERCTPGLTYIMNMGWERILPLEIYSNFKTWK